MNHSRFSPALLLALLAATTSPSLAAQALVSRPRPRTDSVTQRYQDAVIVVRDTLNVMRGALESFRRDLTRVGAETVTSRAGTVLGRCAAATRVLIAKEPVFDPRRAPANPPLLKGRLDSLVTAMRGLRQTIDQQCTRGFALRGTGSRPDTLRAWGGYRIGQIEVVMRKYEDAVSKFAQVAGVELGPNAGRAGR